MANPFEKRATEYLRDDEAFLTVVSPEPLLTFFKDPARQERLWDRLVMIIGTPGSGKTTMTRLFRYSTMRTLLRNDSLDSYRPLISALGDCNAIAGRAPRIIGARIPLESEYREFWEFPYPDELKLGLMTALIQARAILAWMHELEASGVSLADVKIIARENSGAAVIEIGGTEAEALFRRASDVELHIYRISAALVPPSVESITSTASSAYRPFDVIDAFAIQSDGQEHLLQPLVILDDAHSLHAEQFDMLRRWLGRRELKISRWIITRFDALTPVQVLTGPGLAAERDVTYIKMQHERRRSIDRSSFRRMARDMSNRYLRRMDTFNRRGINELSSVLETVDEPLTGSSLERLRVHVDAVQRRTHVTDARRLDLELKVAQYCQSRALAPDMQLAILGILMERYLKRTRNQFPQLDLLRDTSEEVDPEPSVPLTVDAGVADGARVHLLHQYRRPYYFGFEALSDASSENAEQFLQLASVLVDQLETKLIRGREVTLSSREQNRLLRERAERLISMWDFPHADAVRLLVDGIAQACLIKSLEPNASLAGGAVAFGILQAEFDTLPVKYPGLARVMQFAVAYNAVVLVQEHGTKKQKWCLIELGGAALLKYGLTLSRGGFLERGVQDVLTLFGEYGVDLD